MWYPIMGRPGHLHPELPWTPAISLRLRHRRWDRPSRHPAAPGCFVDRHVAPDRQLPLPAVGRDEPDWHQDPIAGLGVSLATAPGGALHDPDDPTGRHAREWDFLRSHLDEALRRYQAAQPLLNHNDWYRDRHERLRTWEICQAIADYAQHWKTRCASMGPSVHPVDVLLGSYHCAGSANIAAALAAVAGIPARRISTSTHSTVEFLIDGRWCWCDNIRHGVRLHPGSFQSFLAGLADWPHLSPEQYQQYARDEVFYRAPYDLDACLRWRFGGGDRPLVGGSGDVAAGIGLSVHYDPMTATALYPEAREQVFHGDAGAEPWLTVGAKGAWLHAGLTLPPGVAARRQLYVSDCADNPIEAAELRVWCDGASAPPTVLLNDQPLTCRGIETERHLHRAAVYPVAPTALQAGWHAVQVSGGSLVCFPDLVQGHAAGVSCAELTIASELVQTDPLWYPEGSAEAAARPRATADLDPVKRRLLCR